MSDLVTRLTDAAEAAIRDQRQSLAHKPEQVRGITIELTIGRDGLVKEAIMFTERRASAGALMGRHIRKEPAA